MAYRVVQWGTGAVGVEAIRGILDHPDLELVGVCRIDRRKMAKINSNTPCGVYLNTIICWLAGTRGIGRVG